ncbi:MAG: hypothetical protein HY287_01700 [Planctomycetes bacterium]|nr:hypothetical protein [Planctomycetota bacterium]MBI3833023.1 hypothetical protein [Planctomycetota bacterium]
MRSNLRRELEEACCAILLACLIGCGTVPSLPATFEVATSATETVSADAGTGPGGLQGVTLSLSRPVPADVNPAPRDASIASGPYGGLLNGQGLQRPPLGEPIFEISFLGAKAAMNEATHNRFFLPQFYGETIPVGGGWVPTTIPALTYKSVSYGAEANGRFGSAVVVHVRLGNLYVGKAILYSWGDIALDQPSNVMFGYLLDFTDGLLESLGQIADQYPVVATIVSEAP